MEHEDFPGVELHNITATAPAEWDESGEQLLRVPDEVGDGLNEMAQGRVRCPSGGEIRFVPQDGEDVEITISTNEDCQFRVFWGPFQPWQPTEIAAGETHTLTLNVPERVAEMDENIETGRFARNVCRVRFERYAPIAVHDVSGNPRTPEAGEVPEKRMLAYGTSITEGAAGSATHMNYVNHAARELGADPLNLGCSGSAYCEESMAEHIAGRDDWEFATLALSVNMANTGNFPVEEFAERAEPFVNTIAEANPEKPVACITLFPYHDDITASGDAEHSAAYRQTLRDIVADAPENVTLLEGPDLLDPAHLGADLLHPGDTGMEEIGENLAAEIEDLV